MAKGNWDNHPNKKYAQIKDLERVEKKFDKFLTNDFYHLILKVKLNTKLLWILLGALIGATVFDQLFKFFS